MLSAINVEKLIAEKKLELEKEKLLLGLSSPGSSCQVSNGDPNIDGCNDVKKQVSFAAADEDGCKPKETKEDHRERTEDLDENIPPDLERYIRRYLGLPVMLRAGEYSPNNPLVRSERNSGDVLLALGEYERRRNTLRRIRQQQYKECLDQQAKKKQEEKKKAKREMREQEQKEREREEREREREEIERERQELERRERERRQVEQNQRSPERRNSENYGSFYTSVNLTEHERRERKRRQIEQRSPERRDSDNYGSFYASANLQELEQREIERQDEQNRRSPEQRRNSDNYGSFCDSVKVVNSAVQVNSVASPLSVAVQTDDSELFRPTSPSFKLTQAERELSPHTVMDPLERVNESNPLPWSTGPTWQLRPHTDRRRSYSDYDERPLNVRKSNRDKLAADLRHSYTSSIFDADAIQRRNMQVEKDAAERRQYYQEELRKQIMEQQRIKEERKTREKMLEQAEMRRLEEQLKMLRGAQDEEYAHLKDASLSMKKDAEVYKSKHTVLQEEIHEEEKLLRGPRTNRRIETSRSDDTKLPKVRDRIESNHERKAYSSNIADDLILSSNYDVDSYLRKNLNFRDRFDRFNIDSIGNPTDNNQRYISHDKHNISNTDNVEINRNQDRVKPKSNDSKIVERRKLVPQNSLDTLPIPVLRHTPRVATDNVENVELSDAMKKVEEKWSVPAVQKNILRSLPNDEGKSMSILTQLGSIRRQLQLEQLKLDSMSKKE